LGSAAVGMNLKVLKFIEGGVDDEIVCLLQDEKCKKIKMHEIRKLRES
jgi:hypothetical protein